MTFSAQPTLESERHIAMRYPQSIRQRYVLVGVPAIFPIALAVTDATSTDAGGSSTVEESLSADSEMPAPVRSVLYRAFRGCHPKIPSGHGTPAFRRFLGRFRATSRAAAQSGICRSGKIIPEPNGVALHWQLALLPQATLCRRQSTSGCTVRPGCRRRTWNY